MFQKTILAVFFTALAAAQDARPVINSAIAALGANVTSVTYTGTAGDVNFLQTMDINGPWPMRPITAYTRAIDLTQPASRATGATNNPGITSTTPAPGVFNQNI